MSDNNQKAEEQFKALNNYTLSVTFNENVSQYRHQGYQKTFNFLSQKITTIYRDAIFQPHTSQHGRAGYHGTESIAMAASATSALAQNIVVENFADLASLEEVKLMHQKLIDEGGAPPPLKNIPRELDKPKKKTKLIKS